MFNKIKIGVFTQMLLNLFPPIILYAVSGLTSSPNNLVLSGCYLYIDDDTNASAIISAELFEVAAEMAELFAGKGVKRSVYSKIKRYGVQFGCMVHEITSKALQILYGQYYAVGAGTTDWIVKNKIVDPGFHTFRIEAETVNDKDIKIYLYNAKNINYGQIALDGEDFSGIPIICKPFPINPSDDTEELCKITIED